MSTLRRRAGALTRRLRLARVFASAMRSRHRPILAQIVPMRRCNLSCSYCNEFDKTSEPVPLDRMLARIDRLADLGTLLVDLSGGEPLLHPDADRLIERIRQRGMMAGLLTNGYLLSPERIGRLNRAGLDRLQISIDNVMPDEVSVKSLKVLDRKLALLAEHAHFDVNINTVVGNGIGRPADALVIAKRARTFGFGTSVGVIHDGDGQIVPLDAERQRVHASVANLGRGFYSHAHDELFQKNLIAGRANAWHCRAGARYLYVCEHGLVHWCSQQRGMPGIPLDQYGVADLEREFRAVKSCAPHCTVSCVHRVSLVDEIREQPLETLGRLTSSSGRNEARRPPASVKLLTWLFVTSRHHQTFRRLASRALRLTR
jgi:MoaA/NifB/PqqE/SkfB family radical SAM enzyme